MGITTGVHPGSLRAKTFSPARKLGCFHQRLFPVHGFYSDLTYCKSKAEREFDEILQRPLLRFTLKISNGSSIATPIPLSSVNPQIPPVIVDPRRTHQMGEICLRRSACSPGPTKFMRLRQQRAKIHPIRTLDNETNRKQSITFPSRQQIVRLAAMNAPGPSRPLRTISRGVKSNNKKQI